MPIGRDEGRELSHERNRELIETVNGGDLVLLLSAGALASRYWHALWANAAAALVGRRLGKPVVLAGSARVPYPGILGPARRRGDVPVCDDRDDS